MEQQHHGKPLQKWDGHKLKLFGDGRPDYKYVYCLFAIYMLKNMMLDQQSQHHSAWYIDKWKDFFAECLDQTRSGAKEKWYDRSWPRMISLYLGDNQEQLMVPLFPPTLTKTTELPGSEAVTPNSRQLICSLACLIKMS